MEIKQTFKIPIKLPWQKNIAFEGAPAAVYDPDELNNGKNYDSSRYANKHGLTVRWVIDVVASPGEDGIKTTYTLKSQPCIIKGDDEQGQASKDFTQLIELYDEAGSNLLGSGDSFTAYNDRNMLMKVTYTNTTGTIASYPDAFGSHFVQKASGGSDIMEFHSNTNRDNRTDIPQTKVSGMATNHLKVLYSGVTIITSCLIDGTKLVPGQEYNFTALLDFE